MTADSSQDPTQGATQETPKAKVRTHTPRPDELTQEVLEFIAAIDDYKRRNMRSFLENTEILSVLFELGYSRQGEEEPELTDDVLDDFAQVRERYRVDEGRLFPTWSEVFTLLSELGYSRAA